MAVVEKELCTTAPKAVHCATPSNTVSMAGQNLRPNAGENHTLSASR